MGKSIGIDLGTSNTVVSYFDKKGRIKNLEFGRNYYLPSAIYFQTKNDYIFGNEAIERGVVKPEALVRNFKSLMGSKEKINIVAENGDKLKVTAKEIAKLLLVKVFDKATQKIAKDFPGEFVDKAVITVPAKFSPQEKEATKWAAERAGIEEIKLATESTAAAVAYAEEYGIGKQVLIYDFGGGTFDVSLIEKVGEGYRDVVTPAGDKELGGNILTKRVMAYIFEKISDDLGIDMPLEEDDDGNLMPVDPREYDEDDYEMLEDVYYKNYIEIYQVANTLKEHLSTDSEYTEMLDIYINEEDYKTFPIDFTRKRLMHILEDDIDKTIKIIEKFMQDGNIDSKEIGNIILAGGSSLIPAVQEKVSNYFKREVVLSKDTATLISKGACLLTSKLDGVMELDQILANDIGILVSEGGMLRVFNPLIKAGTSYSKATTEKYYQLTQDGQRQLRVDLYERDVVNYPDARRPGKGCTLIEELRINLPEGLKQNDTKIKLGFQITSEGIMKMGVTVQDYKGNTIVEEEAIYKSDDILN